MEYTQNSLESFMTNPGFEHLGRNILKHLNKKTILALRLGNHASQYFVDNSRFFLKKLKCKQEQYEAWYTLIRKIEEQNPDLRLNIALNLIKLNDNYQDIKELFPLNVFSLFGDLSLVKFIVENSMVESMGKNSKYGNTAIHHAAGRGHDQIVKALIGCIWNPYAPNDSGWTHTDIAKCRISTKCKDFTINNDFKKNFYTRIVAGDIETVKAVIECIDNPNAPDNSGDTPLHFAAKFGKTEIVKALITCGNDPNVPNDWGWTPIHQAANQGFTEIVKILIGCTDNPNAPNDSGRTPIHHAAKFGHTEIVRVLIGCSDNPNVPDNHGWTPIHYAAQSGRTEVVKALIGYTDNPNAPNNRGWTPIHHAAGNGHTEIVKILMGCTDNPNAPNNEGVTPINFATRYGRTEAVKALIGSIDNPNAPDKDGWTLIHEAAKFGHTEIVEILINITDNPNPPDNDGDTPFDIAKSYNFFRVMNLLNPKNRRT